MQRCGLCTLLTRLLRRAMCVGSRRGSGDSSYHELADTAAPDAGTMETTDSSIYFRLLPTQDQQQQSPDPPPPPPSQTHHNHYHHHQQYHAQPQQIVCNHRRMSDTDIDRPLIEALLVDDQLEHPRRRYACTGRFLTMHKRRRKKLTTRALVQDTAILDDVLHGQVQCILNQVSNWRFNAFTLENVTGGRSLPVLCVHLFHWYGLLDHFNLDVVRLWKLFTLIEEGYHSTNPYHNSIHATDVTQAMHCFLQERKILEHLEPLEVMASLIGAVTHDLDHPGVNQPFLIATSNHLAALYENTSVLENHHWRSAVGCLLESGVAEQIQDIRPELEKQISSLILATDITRQHEFLARFREYLDTNTLDMRLPEARHFILQISLKCADISNPCRPWDVSKKWSQKVCEEFFRQGDYERQLNLPVTSLCDRFTTSVPKIQVGFFKFVVTPLFDEWHRFLDTNLSHNMMHNLKYNQRQWESKVAHEMAEETKTEISDADILEEDVDENENEDHCIDLSDSSEVLIPEPKQTRRSSLQVPKFTSCRFDRRHSVPVNPPRIILPPRENVSRETIREDTENRIEHDEFSISSGSDSGPRKSSTGSVPDHERPLSAETLVPDLSIAAMSTDSDCADRLNIVMHGAISFNNTLTVSNVSKQLIRQQTFPPLQPYMRTRYMSATAEMGSCTEYEIKSSSSDSPTDPDRRPLPISRKESFKREQDFNHSEKASKMAKLTVGYGQKENQDPTIKRKGSNRRRGSAPMAVMIPPPKMEESSFFKKCDRSLRRLSVPVDVMTQSNTVEERISLEMINTARRASAPCENVLMRSGTSKARRARLSRRRSSSGAEILSPILAEPEPEPEPTSSTGRAIYRMDTFFSNRRGSLPIDILGFCHSGPLSQYLDM